MSNQPQNFFTRTRILLLAALAITISIAAAVIIYANYSGTLIPTQGTPAPITINNNSQNQTSGDKAVLISSGVPFKMNLTLSEGQAQPQPLQPIAVLTGEPLDPAEAGQLLARIPALPTTLPDPAGFNRPAESLPPPVPGNVIPQSFPPQDNLPAPTLPASAALKVLRFAPEGEIPIAPFISITFNQPMVPLTTLAQLSAADVPVTIQPALPGTWRWLGTRTLTFQSDSTLVDRLPKATRYQVTIPAGTRSVSGGTLSQAVSWNFTTPAPKIISSYPYDTPQPLQPLMFIGFDQRIDPSAVLRTITVSAGQTASLPIVPATADEIKADPAVARLVADSQEARYLVFRAVQPFSAGTRITVTVEPGTPSAEGPLVTTAAQSYQFSTYEPLQIVNSSCSWSADSCPPLAPFYIQFNNSLDEKLFTEDMLKVTPQIPGVTASLYGNSITIQGQTKGRTTYTVIVSGKLQDVYGQKLGADARLIFKVGSSEPVLIGSGQNFITLDPASAKALFSVYAINYNKLNLQINAVQPEDWTLFKQYVNDFQQSGSFAYMPGKKLADKSLSLNLPADTLTQVDVDLSQYMTGKTGHFIVQIQPPKALIESDQARYRRLSQTVLTWVQITQIGLDAFNDHSSMLAWAASLKDGSPLPGVSITANNGAASVITGADGTARFPIPSGASFLIASLGADRALLPASSSSWSEQTWTTQPSSDELRWTVFDDRQMYRPGEEVHIKGWLRLITGGQTGDVGLPGSGVNAVTYRISDPQGNDIGTGSAPVNALGGFDLVYTIPANANLGSAQITFNIAGSLNGMSGSSFYHSFQIQEFRRPEFEVIARSESAAPYFAGGQAVLAVDAKYYAGGGLPNADVTWQVSTTSANYSPPNWSDYVFGTWRPWWVYDSYYWNGGSETRIENFNGKTDAAGTHYLRLNFDQGGDPAVEPGPQSVSAQVTVMDVNRQAWSSSTSLLVHPADVYIGLKSDRTFVEQGTPLKIDFIVTDLDGKPAPGHPVQIFAARLEWKVRQGNWTEEKVDIQTCSKTSTAEPDSCLFATTLGGTYQITAQVSDSLGRLNQSRFTRWVSGGKQPASRTVEQEKVTLIPDKQTYQPGDIAHILVQSPFSPAEGLLTVSRSGILSTTRFHMNSGSTSLDVPITSAHIPNLEIQVDLAGSAQRMSDDGLTPLPDIPARPAYALGTLHLSIPPLQRTLSVQVTPAQDKLAPGAQTSLNVTLKDAAGLPVADAELAVVVVDEAILALSNYQPADPLAIFYSDRPADFTGIYSRASLVLLDPNALAGQISDQNTSQRSLAGNMPSATAAPAMEAAVSAPSAMAKEAAPNPISVRSDFNPLALFSPVVRTGADGSATIPFKLPDNLTRYRVMVIAVDSLGQRFGSGEASLTARLPLMVRPSAPRFLNFGDRFELPVVLQNQTDTVLTVGLAARASNLFLGSAGSREYTLRVSIPPNDRVEVRLPAETDGVGTARVQIAAASAEFADAAVIELPVYTPSTSEAFATYGVIDSGAAAQPLQYPTGVFPQYGGLEISASSTALQALTDAVLYLNAYPYECSEQLASRILAIAALRDVLTAFKAAELPSPESLQARVATDIQRLSGMQNYDGGFPYWQRGYSSSPFNTIHVAHALARAAQKSYVVPADMQQNLLNYLRQVESYYPEWYSPYTRHTLSAYALYVRNLLNDRDSAKASSLLQEAGLDNLSLDAIGWLWQSIDDPAMLEQIRLKISNRVVETASAANFTSNYDDQNYLLLGSDRRTDAILLDALINLDGQSDLIPKLVNGLLAHRNKGRWDNTQENVFVLLALDNYFNTYETQTPDFVAQLWLGSTYAGSSTFQGRTTDQHQTNIPMSTVMSETATAGGTQNLILNKQGTGRLYYRLGLRYAPTDLHLPALDMGFVVSRSYEAVDNPGDVSRGANGEWLIKAGARVRVKLSMVADNRRCHVALVDPLPAGLEIINPALAVSGDVPQNPSGAGYRYGWWWWGTWYEHQNLRDDRAEAFTSLLWDGVYEYSYTARATTPGAFVVPPAKAEEMYTPEVFGRSSTDQVIIK